MIDVNIETRRIVGGESKVGIISRQLRRRMLRPLLQLDRARTVARGRADLVWVTVSLQYGSTVPQNAHDP